MIGSTSRSENPVEIRKTHLRNCAQAEGVVVVIDVLRAFTTTAFAFDRGASEILLVSTVEDAFEQRERDPDCLLMGEVDGLPIDGFDLPNSPAMIDTLDLRGRRLVMRTTAGTQGVVLARNAGPLYAAGLGVAAATAREIRRLEPDLVSFVETGVRARGGGEEDSACADYIAGLLTGSPPSREGIRRRVSGSRAALKFTDPNGVDFPRADLRLALQADRFDFAMRVERRDGLAILRPTGGGREPA